jgi:putative NIF3 family GTP cyclohydrolase 1 type 2
MDTQQIMKTALKLAYFKSIPADSEIHVKGKVRKALVAIDVSVGELMLARDLGCDGVIAHHPAGGTARLEGYKVFQRHIDQMREVGVPAEVAEEAVKNKYNQLEIQRHPDNYDQTTSAAKKLRMSLLSIHSPCDEIGRRIILSEVRKLARGATVGDLVDRISRLPEFRKAKTKIQVRLGSSRNKAGKIAISHAAYTNGGYDIAKTYFEYQIGTVSYIHISDTDLAKLVTDGLGNLIELGHIASDWLGLNPLLDKLEKNGVEVVATTDLRS